MRLVSPRACRRMGWEVSNGHGQAVCSAMRVCLMDRAAQSTTAVHACVPYQCRLVYVRGSRVPLAQSERSRRQCPGAS